MESRAPFFSLYDAIRYSIGAGGEPQSLSLSLLPGSQRQEGN
jgi:hypothetical protein